MSIPALNDLMKTVAIVPPPSPVPGKPFTLSLSPPPETFNLLAGDQPAAAFKLVLDKVDLPGLDIDAARRTLGLDVGTLSPTLDIDVGSLVPTLNALLGDLSPTLDTTLGTLTPNLDATMGTLQPALQAVLGAMKPELRAVVGALAADLELALAAESGSITGTMAQDPDKPGSITGTIGQDPAQPGSITGTIAQDPADPGSIIGTITQDPGHHGTVTGTIVQDPAKPGSITGTIGQDPARHGSITGTIGHAAGMVGSITVPSLQQKVGQALGLIEGSVVRSVLGEVKPTVQWRVEDEAGRALRSQNDANPECVIQGALDDVTTAPTVALLPEFVEFTANTTDLFTRRKVFCNLTVTASVPGLAEPIALLAEVGPLEIPVPKIRVPTILVMTEHATSDTRFLDGGVLLAVPSNSQIESLPQLAGVLGDVTALADLVAQHAPSTIAGRFEGLSIAIGRIKALVTSNRVRGVKANIVDDLWWMDIPGRWPANFEDCLSALFLSGPPGRKVTCHVKKNLWEAEGIFQVTLGAFAWAIAENFSDTEPTASGRNGPKLLRPQRAKDKVSLDGGSMLDVIAGDPSTSPTGSFNDALSSFQFLGPNEPYVFQGL